VRPANSVLIQTDMINKKQKLEIELEPADIFRSRLLIDLEPEH